MNYYDYIIVGSGIAGLYTALLAKEYGTVLILTKGGIDDCNTRHAQGGIAAPIDKKDSPDLHFQDTIAAGNGLCDPEAVRILVDEATDRIADLIKFGVPFDTVNGEIALTKEAAHSMPRILHAGGDATGEHIEITLSRRVLASSIKVLEYCLVTEIITDNGTVNGVRSIDCRTGLAEEYECKSVILATGGAGKMFKYTANSDVATGDGNILAYKAGAEVKDMEFFQFHPTAIRIPGVPPFLISEAVRGEGGILRDIESRAFMTDYTPDADLAPRDVVARSILYQMKKTKSTRVFLDVTHISPQLITTRFPHIYQFCLDHGLDITKNPIPVAPTAHYYMGGVKVNIWGETNIEGLFAAGETACTGVHGANRLASNSLLEVIVFSKRILEKTQYAQETTSIQANNKKVQYYSLDEYETQVNVPSLNLPNIQSLLWDKVGIIRSGEELTEVAKTLYAWQKLLHQPLDRPSYELGNIIMNARFMTEASLLRLESRGAHYRTDFPHTSNDWQKHIIFTLS
ncbi:L-aspartate oxidase [Chloroflexota bacterium]